MDDLYALMTSIAERITWEEQELEDASWDDKLYFEGALEALRSVYQEGKKLMEARNG